MITARINNKIVGGRIVKTGIAVLLTSVFCYLLEWPVMFAVITAIVTIEPTARDSIQKAFIRFPASAIGAAYAVLFTYLLGDQPYTYTIVALGTLVTCHKLRLHAGILVATLTGVAMISTVHDHYTLSFFVRLGTTGIGLIVSSLVNLLVIHPDYSKGVMDKIKFLSTEAGSYVEMRGKEIISRQPMHKETKRTFEAMIKNLNRVETLCNYQKMEWKLYHSSRKSMKIFHYENKKVAVLRQLMYHLGILNSLNFTKILLNDVEKQEVMNVIDQILKIIQMEDLKGLDSTVTVCKEHLIQISWLSPGEAKEPINSDNNWNRRYLFIELACIYDLVKELKKIEKIEKRKMQSYYSPSQSL